MEQPSDITLLCMMCGMMMFVVFTAAWLQWLQQEHVIMASWRLIFDHATGCNNIRCIGNEKQKVEFDRECMDGGG